MCFPLLFNHSVDIVCQQMMCLALGAVIESHWYTSEPAPFVHNSRRGQISSIPPQCTACAEITGH
jgi:hypothetical protein